jgi:hypothetical protein
MPAGSSLTAWDARTFARGAAIALATLGIAFVVTAASDEGGVARGERAGRALPIAPLCAAIGAWLALAPGRARGEDVALAALGRSPWQRHAAAIAGGASVAVLAALVIAAVPRVDVRGFYPRAEQPIAWRPVADGFASGDGRWHVAADGTPERSESAAAPGRASSWSTGSSSLPRGARAAAALATALAGLALPMLAAGARSRRRAAAALAAVVGTSVLTVLAFQAAAAARAPALVAPAAPLLLLAAVATGYRASPWRKARSPR